MYPELNRNYALPGKDSTFLVQLSQTFRLPLKFEIAVVFICCLQAKSAGISNISV